MDDRRDTPHSCFVATKSFLAKILILIQLFLILEKSEAHCPYKVVLIRKKKLETVMKKMSCMHIFVRQMN